MAKTKTGGLGRGLGALFEDAGFDPQPASIIPENVQEKETEVKETITPEKAAPKKKETKKTSKDDAGKASREEIKENVVYIKLSEIKPNSKQPRKEFSEEALDDLAASILEYGVIQPVLVRRANVGYELVAGERRWRAARKAGLKQIPAIIRDIDDRQNAFYALIENMQREDLNSIEEAEGIQEIMNDYGLNQEEAAKVIGKSRPYVANSLRLLKLPEDVKQMVVEKKLTAGHARAIAGLKGEELQKEAAAKAVKNGWSVRQIESYTGEKAEPGKKRKRSKSKPQDIRQMENRLTEVLGTKVTINGTERKGKLELEYYSKGELERLLEILLDQ